LSADVLLIILVAAMAVAMVIQVVFVVGTMRSAKTLLDRTKLVTKQLEAETREVIGELKTVSSSLDDLKATFEEVGQSASSLSTMISDRAVDLDQLVEKLISVGSTQSERVDSVVRDTFAKFEETTSIIQQDLLKPIVQIASLAKGIRAGLEYLVTGRSQSARGEAYPEDDLFI